MIMDVTVSLCVGLYGVCVISLINDEYDAVSLDIERFGADAWLDALPDHPRPMEGIYTIECRVKVADFGCKYLTVKSTEGVQAVG
jgi:hypothetical protein